MGGGWGGRSETSGLEGPVYTGKRSCYFGSGGFRSQTPPPPWGCLPSSKKTGHHHLANLVSFPLGRGSLGLTSTGINLTPIHPPWACNFSTDFLEGRGVTHTLAKNQSVASQGGGAVGHSGNQTEIHVYFIHMYSHMCEENGNGQKHFGSFGTGSLEWFLTDRRGGGGWVRHQSVTLKNPVSHQSIPPPGVRSPARECPPDK